MKLLLLGLFVLFAYGGDEELGDRIEAAAEDAKQGLETVDKRIRKAGQALFGTDEAPKTKKKPKKKEKPEADPE